MDVFSELNSAQLENLSVDPASGTKGHIYFKSTTEPIKITDGTQTHVVLTDKIGSTVRDVVVDAGLDNADITQNSISSAPITFTTSSTSFVDITSLTVTLTAAGSHPVDIFLYGGYISVVDPTAVTSAVGEFRLLRNGVSIATFPMSFGATGMTAPSMSVPSSAIRWIDGAPDAGANIYKLQAKVSVGTASAGVFGVYLYAKEF